jgi:HAD superfamily hydrolase (TIGR01509 family)
MKLPTDLKLVIFDFDGVIVDSEIIALDELCHLIGAYGVPMTLDETRQRFLGTSISAPMAYISEMTGEECPGAFADEWHERLFRRYRTELAVLPGINDMLNGLDAQSVNYCIASGSSRKRLKFALDCTGLIARFEHRAFSADLVERGKPAPDLFLHVAARYGAEPAGCIVIEDAPAGVHAAVSAGMYPVGFIGGSHLSSVRTDHSELLIQSGARSIIHNYDEFADSLSEFPAAR